MGRLRRVPPKLERGSGGLTAYQLRVPSSSPVYDRVVERRRAVALARHFREAEGLSIAPIADRLGRSPATIKAYFYDPTGEKARAVKARYVGGCRGCGGYTQPRNGKGDAYSYCKRCHRGAAQPRWTRLRASVAIRVSLWLKCRPLTSRRRLRAGLGTPPDPRRPA
jgi:AraC-like DNA-binding protein